MKASALCLMLLLSGCGLVMSQPDFLGPEGPDVVFGTAEPDKDGPVTPDGGEEEKPTEPAEPEEVKPPNVAVAPPPAGGAEIDPDMELPEPQNCSGVMCDFDALSECEEPVLFAKQCCPVCPPVDPCNGVECNDSEVCSVFNGRAVCCTDLGSTPSYHRHYPHSRHGRGAYQGLHAYHGYRGYNNGRQHYSSAVQHHSKLRCRYDLPNNCTLRFADELASAPTRGPCPNASCTEMEACVIRLNRTIIRNRFWRYPIMRRVPKCCELNRPDCPLVERPTVLGMCHLPGEPIPMKNKTCSCTDVSWRGKRGVGHGGRYSVHARVHFHSSSCRAGRRYAFSYRRSAEGTMQRCRCECQKHESFEEGANYSHDRCQRMRQVTNECRNI